MANPVDSLPDLFSGLWKKHTDNQSGGPDPFPEIRIAPHVPQDAATGQYMVLNTRPMYDAQKQNADYAAWDGEQGQFQDLDYQVLTTALRPFKSLPVRVTDAIRRGLEAQNPNLGVLDSALELVTTSIRGRLGAEIATEVAALTNTNSLDLSVAGTDVGKNLAEEADDIAEATGHRPNVFACGRRAVTRMLTNNTIIQGYQGQASTGGATKGAVSEAGLRQYLRDVAGCELVIIDRVTKSAAGAAAFQWSTSAFFGVANSGDLPSCLKTCAPTADLFEVFVDRLRAFEKGGPGDVFSAQGLLDVVTADADLGTVYTLTL